MTIFSTRGSSNVRIWNPAAQRPVGVGFLVDARHVMTCAHVVTDSLGRTAQSGRGGPPPADPVIIDFPRFDQGLRRVAHVVADTWCAGGEDIAVLALAPDEALPPGSEAVFAATSAEANDPIIGYGVGADLPEGKIISGRMLDFTGDRLTITTDNIDLAVRPGCSGSAIWNVARGGIIGMVAEMQQDTIGRLIPVTALARMWPIRGQVPAVRAGGRLNHQLRDLIHSFDREDQESEFEMALSAMYDEARKPIICTIAGIADDLPLRCQDRCVRGRLRTRFERENIDSSRVRTMQLSWPRDRRFDTQNWLARMKAGLRSHIGGSDFTPAGLRETYSRSLHATIFFSEVSQSQFMASRDQKILLRDWIAFWSEIGAGRIDKPLMHFLIVNLDDPVQLAAGEPGLQKSYKRFLEVAQSPATRPLPLLNHFEPRHVDIWIDNIGNELNLDHDALLALKSGAYSAFAKARQPRLKDLDDWIEKLAN